MITLTKEFRRSLADDDRSYSASAVIILADQTRIELADDEIWSDGFAVEDAVSDDDNFTALGATVINAATLIIDNTRDKYIGYDFMNADVTMSISKTFGEGTEQERTEVVKMGTFRVDDPNYDEATITLSMLDMMEQFDRPYELSSLQYPATLAEIVRDACAICLGSSSKLATQTFPHSDYVVQEAPKDRACTFREVIGWAATIAGCFARCNRDGELEIKWFNTAALENASGTDGGQFDSGTPYYTTGDSLDGGTFSPWSTGSEADGGLFTDNIPLHYVGRLYSQKIAVDETVITKVAITVEDDSADAEQKTLTFETGTAGYTIQIEGNKFITKATAQTVCNWLGQQMIGLRFRKCNVTQADDPSIEAGDVGLLFDSRQNECPILITRMVFEIGGPQTIVCGSETPSRNSATRFTQATKSFVESRKLLKQQKNAYEQALEDLADDIEHNAHGLYAEEIADPDDPNATIYCLHDKPLLADSDVRIHVSTIGIAVTKNGTAQQPTWYALRVDGTLIASILNTIGLNFSWGVGGELRIMKGNTETLYVNADTGVVRINCDSFSLSNGDTIASIAEGKANTAVSNQSQSDIFNKLTGGGTAQGIFLQNGQLYINGQYVQAGTLRLEDYSYTGANSTVVLEFTEMDIKGTTGEFKNELNYLLDDFDATGNTTYKFLRHAFKGSTEITTMLQGAGRTGGFTLAYTKMPTSSQLLTNNSRPVRIDVHDDTLGSRTAVAEYTDSKAFKKRIYYGGNYNGRVQSLCEAITGYHYGDGNTDEYGSVMANWRTSPVTYVYKITNRQHKWMGSNLALESSSSRRYKHAIEYGLTGDRDPHGLLALRVAEFIFNPGHPLQYADMRGKTIPGLIAEDVADVYPSAAITDPETGQIESWDERRIIPGMLALIQEQHEKLEEQQKQLNRQQMQIGEMQAEIRELKELVQKAQDKADSAYRLAWI